MILHHYANAQNISFSLGWNAQNAITPNILIWIRWSVQPARETKFMISSTGDAWTAPKQLLFLMENNAQPALKTNTMIKTLKNAENVKEEKQL